jgi:hypothetical protein
LRILLDLSRDCLSQFFQRQLIEPVLDGEDGQSASRLTEACKLFRKCLMSVCQNIRTLHLSIRARTTSLNKAITMPVRSNHSKVDY